MKDRTNLAESKAYSEKEQQYAHEQTKAELSQEHLVAPSVDVGQAINLRICLRLDRSSLALAVDLESHNMSAARRFSEPNNKIPNAGKSANAKENSGKCADHQQESSGKRGKENHKHARGKAHAPILSSSCG
jgi:electron transfer flavoprotein alpha subunit